MLFVTLYHFIGTFSGPSTTLETRNWSGKSRMFWAICSVFASCQRVVESVWKDAQDDEDMR
jgi:hypothetical protein